jgi:hypothetical protein
MKYRRRVINRDRKLGQMRIQQFNTYYRTIVEYVSILNGNVHVYTLCMKNHSIGSVECCTIHDTLLAITCVVIMSDRANVTIDII